MSTLIILLIYFIGCTLSFGRVNASIGDIPETIVFRTIAVFFSWIGFITGILIYYTRNEEHFFKWDTW